VLLVEGPTMQIRMEEIVVPQSPFNKCRPGHYRVKGREVCSRARELHRQVAQGLAQRKID
jgi:hypothetical protein